MSSQTWGTRVVVSSDFNSQNAPFAGGRVDDSRQHEGTYNLLFLFGKGRLEFEQDNVDECHDGNMGASIYAMPVDSVVPRSEGRVFLCLLMGGKA